jgi:hypothetical protein
VQADDVYLLEKLIERKRRDAVVLEYCWGDVWIGGDDAESERAGAIGDSPADAAQADQAKGKLPQGWNWAAQDASCVVGVLDPGTLAQRVVKLHDAPVERQDEGERMVGNFSSAIVGHVCDHDATLGCRVKINVIDANGVTADDPAARERFDDAPGDGLAGGDEERISIVCERNQVVLGPADSSP